MPPIKTRDRILITSLELFNLCGEPNTTTIDIANEMDISPGNLYYHFRNKDEITTGLFALYETAMNEALEPPKENKLEMLDYWMYVHIVFEKIWEFRFLHRDMVSILERNERLQKRFNRVIDRMQAAWAAVIQNMRRDFGAPISDEDIDAVANSAVITAMYWLNYQQIRAMGNAQVSANLGLGVYQLLLLISPWLQEEQRDELAAVAATYL
ncbi:Transcriptional regulator [gamma proteobacterium HdN1]|nr:Transcriptional regulator [gamma proteobacterium HdN1]